MNSILLLSIFSVTFIFGWNNSSICVGGLIGSRILNYRKSIILVSLGLFLGLLLEGYKMGSGYFIAPTGNEIGLCTVFLVTSALLFTATVYRIPTSLTHLLIFSLLASDIYYGLKINILSVGLLLLWWLASPILSFFLSKILVACTRNFFQGLNLLKSEAFNKIGGMFTGFYLAYSLGANNIGFILSFIDKEVSAIILNILIKLLIVLTTVIGIYVFSGKIVKSFGEDLIVLSPKKTIISFISASFTLWISTQIGFPSPLSTYVLGAMMGAGTASKKYLVNLRYLKKILEWWIIIAVLSFISTIALLYVANSI